MHAERNLYILFSGIIQQAGTIRTSKNEFKKIGFWSILSSHNCSNTLVLTWVWIYKNNKVQTHVLNWFCDIF